MVLYTIFCLLAAFPRIDAHQGWTGPCDVMVPSLQDWWMNQDDAAQVAALHSFNLDLPRQPVPEKVEGDDGAVAGGGGGDEEDEPDRWDDIDLLKEFAEYTSCRPLFLLVRNGAVVGKVAGANAPEVRTAIELHVPDPPKDEDTY